MGAASVGHGRHDEFEGRPQSLCRFASWSQETPEHGSPDGIQRPKSDLITV